MNMSLLKIMATAIVLLPQLAFASIEGRWTTISDETGKAQSIVNIEVRENRLYARIEQILPPKPADAICEQCPAPFNDLPVAGMQIVNGLKLSKKSGRWKGGQIFSPDKKRSYKAEIWLENEQRLNVRGYMGFVYKTQTWVRVDD